MVEGSLMSCRDTRQSVVLRNVSPRCGISGSYQPTKRPCAFITIREHQYGEQRIVVITAIYGYCLSSFNLSMFSKDKPQLEVSNVKAKAAFCVLQP